MLSSGCLISRWNFISLVYKACAVSLYTIPVRKVGGHFATLFFNMSQNDLKCQNCILLIFSAIHITTIAFRSATPRSRLQFPNHLISIDKFRPMTPWLLTPQNPYSNVWEVPKHFYWLHNKASNNIELIRNTNKHVKNGHYILILFSRFHLQ